MRKQRDDKAIRRVPTPTTKAAETLETAVADKGDNSAEAVVKRDEVSVASGGETKSAAAA